jgi:hypothetical protein
MSIVTDREIIKQLEYINDQCHFGVVRLPRYNTLKYSDGKIAAYSDDFPVIVDKYKLEVDSQGNHIWHKI